MAKTAKNQLPNAWIVSSKDRGRKKIKKGNIYLNDKEEFEIELHNPTDKNVLAIINLDGKSICSSGLIIRRGERVYLDCFIDDKKKFIFETYLVDDTKESKAAIASNGNLEVFFYNEKPNRRYTPPVRKRSVKSRHFFNDDSYGAGGGQAIYADNLSNIIRGSSTTAGEEYCNTCTTLSDDMSVEFDSVDVMVTTSISSIETGQISKGDDSLQNFVEVDMDFESTIFTRLTYTLLPESRRPKTKRELKTVPSVVDKYDHLMRIKELLDAGAIDQQEYDSAKGELMV